MRALVVIFLWIVLTFSFLRSKVDNAAETKTRAKMKLYMGTVDFKLNKGAPDIDLKKTKDVPVRIHVIERMATSSMSVRMDFDPTPRMSFYMDKLEGRPPRTHTNPNSSTSSTNTANNSTDAASATVEAEEEGHGTYWGGESVPRMFPLFKKACELNLELNEGSEGATGWFNSTDCGFSATFTASPVDLEQIGNKAVHWSILLNLCTIFEIRAFMSQFVANRLQEVSPFTIGTIAIYGVTEAAFIVGLGMNYSLEFNAFSVVALFKFVVFALLHMSFLGKLWKARLPDDSDIDYERQKLASYYIRFFLVVAVCLLAIVRLWYFFPIVVVLFQSFLIPQIIYDIYHGYKNSITPTFIVMITISKLIPALYLYGCPHTLFKEPMPTLPGNDDGSGNIIVAICTVAVSLLFMAIALSQRKFGPRWFTPAICLPHVYNYLKQVEMKDGVPFECSICMSDIEPNIGQTSVTPCDHIFHRTCLEQWFEVKMECPICRSTLPPLETVFGATAV